MFKKGKSTPKKSKSILLRLLIALSVLLVVEIGFAARVVGYSDDGFFLCDLMEDTSCVETTVSHTEPSILVYATTAPTYVEVDADPILVSLTEAPTELESEPTSVLPEAQMSTIPSDETTEAVTETESDPIEETQPERIELSEEDTDLILRIAMAEVGCDECLHCAALVMRTVLNRIESDEFSDSVYDVLYARNQFEPIWNGTFKTAVPDDICREALELVQNGWDESQGALYFEACIGPSWHSRNLKLLFQHCSTRFYK